MPVSFSTITAESWRHAVFPPGTIRPYTPAPASDTMPSAIPANVALPVRRNGGCSGSVSRVTSADVARCTRNWYACSWSRLDATGQPPSPRTRAYRSSTQHTTGTIATISRISKYSANRPR